MNRELALGIWAKCLRENAWPGYPSGTLRLECPPWHEAMMTDWKDAQIEHGDAQRYAMNAVRHDQSSEQRNYHGAAPSRI